MENSKFEFVKETSYKNEVFYYTRKNGRLVPDSLSFDEDKARNLYNVIIENKIESKIEVLETNYNG